MQSTAWGGCVHDSCCSSSAQHGDATTACRGLVLSFPAFSPAVHEHQTGGFVGENQLLFYLFVAGLYFARLRAVFLFAT